jgi:hypothetical protein
MLRQDQPPDQVILVLCDEEFPSRELPRKLREQQQRGLEILWVRQNTRSYQKLLPSRLAYPSATIITVDDDALYRRWLVRQLMARAQKHPGALIGHRGWAIQCDATGLAPYTGWPKASEYTPSEQVFLTGVGGILYPPDVLPIELLTDVNLAMELCPTSDDIWFWAVAKVAHAPVQCLGLPSYRPLRRQAGTPQLQTINRREGENDVQLTRVIEHFGL